MATMTSVTQLALWALIGLPAIVGAGLLLSPLWGRGLKRTAAAISVTVSAAGAAGAASFLGMARSSILITMKIASAMIRNWMMVLMNTP